MKGICTHGNLRNECEESVDPNVTYVVFPDRKLSTTLVEVPHWQSYTSATLTVTRRGKRSSSLSRECTPASSSTAERKVN